MLIMMDTIMLTEWIRCPVCGNKTRNRVRMDTELKNFPLFCPKCKHENIINLKSLQITIVRASR